MSNPRVSLHGDKPEVSAMVERVARIVDPYGWATFDRHLRGLLDLRLDPEAYQGRWMYVSRSLDAASEILALLSDDAMKRQDGLAQDDQNLPTNLSKGDE